MTINSDELTGFFEQWRELSTPPTLPAYLSGFFDDWRQLPQDHETLPDADRKTYVFDPQALSQWFAQLEQPLLVAKRSGHLCDPWDVVGLKRDEVRNSAVLAWLLNPRGSHGFGDVALQALLGLVAAGLDAKRSEAGVQKPICAFPTVVGKGCMVRAEECPDGDISNRIDIVVDDPSFYLLIEVKIRAQEGVDQLSRYAEVAERCRGSRPFAIVFLTPQGRMPKTAGRFDAFVVPLSWRKLARMVEPGLPASVDGSVAQMVTHLLAERFLRHVSRF